jgi:N utilization substance protein B
MATRRLSREFAVQLLYQIDLNPEPLDTAFAEFWSERPCDPKTREFAETLARGVADNLETLDGLIQEHATNWDIRRITTVDRNVLRVALYEMLHCPDIPPVVSINEAVDIAKKFGTEESGRFLNGILDSVMKELPRPSRDAGSAPAAT